MIEPTQRSDVAKVTLPVAPRVASPRRWECTRCGAKLVSYRTAYDHGLWHHQRNDPLPEGSKP